MSIFDKPITTGQSSPSSSTSGGSIFNSPITTTSYNQNPTVTKNSAPTNTQMQGPSIISSIPQVVSGIAKGISIGNLIVTAATRQATQPQIDVSKVVLPTPQPLAPQKTITITPNQKVLTPSQLKIVAPQPVSGQSATIKPAKAGAPTIIDRYVGLVSKTMPEAVKAGDQTASDISRFIKSPTTFQSSASYDANNTDGLVKSLITKKVTDFLHLPHEVPGMIEAIVKAVASPIGQGLSLAMQEKLNPPKTVSETVGLKAKQLANAGTIALTPINAFFAAADKMPIVSEIMRASIIPFVAVGEIAHKSISKLVDALPISEKAKNDIKGPLSELAALAAQVVVGHSLASVSGEAVGKLNDVGKEAFTKMTKDIVETSGGKTTVSFSPQDILDLKNGKDFGKGGKYAEDLKKALFEEPGKKGNVASRDTLWGKAVREGVTLELPFEKIVGMVDKPWWGKIKKFLNMEPTKATSVEQVPGRIADAGVTGETVPIEKKITALLPENINHNPQAVIDAVMKGKLETTPEGKGLIKAALEAQQSGTDLTIASKQPTASPGREITPQDRVIMEQIKTLEPIAKADMQKAQAEADMRSAATQDMGLRPKDRQDFARLGALIKNAEDKGMIDVQSLKKTSSALLNWGLERWREIKPQAAQMGDDEILREIQDFTSQNQLSKVSRVEKPASVTLLEDLKKSLQGIAKDNPKDIARTLDQAYQEAGVDPQTGKVDKKTEALDYLNKKSSDTVKFRTTDQNALEAQAYTNHARTLIERRKNLKLEHPDWLDTNDVLTQNEKAINAALDLAAKARSSAPKYRVAKEIKTVKDAKDLFVLHNLSPSGIDKAFAEGGIPAPSLAVTKKDNSFSDFGEVTLIGDKNLIDPKKKDVTVYSGDVYTTRTPRPEYTAKSVYKTDLGNELEKRGIYFGDFDSISPSQALNRLISPRISENAYSLTEAEKIINQIYSDPYITLKSADPSPLVKSIIQTIPSVSRLIRQSQSAWNLELQIENDQRIYERLTELANKNKEDINDLVNNLVSGVYTRNPYTAENKVARAKELIGRNKDELRGTEQGWGAGASPRIFGYKKLLSIEDIRANKDILTTKEKATQIGSLREENLYNFLMKRSYSVDAFSNGDLFKEIVSREKFNDGKFIRDYLSGFDGFKKITLADATQIGILIKKAYVNVPTDYFESKIMRVVGLGEFKGALVSQDTLPETIKKLQDSGLKVVKYDPGIEGDRLKKLQDNFSTELFRVKDDVKVFTGKTITDAQEQEIIDLNKKIFGDDNVKITLQIMANEKALGQYYDSMIQVVDGQANPTDTYLHEAVHKYLDIFSTKEEYAGALVEGQKKYKLEDFAQVEEKIAEDFIKFAKDQSTFTGRIKAFFGDLLRRIKAYFGNKSEIDKLYNDIISGKAATASEVKTGATAEMSKMPTNTDAQVPVGTGELKKSKAYTRVFDLLKEEFQQDVSYNVLNLEKDAKNAVDFIAKDPKAAIRIGLGLEQPPEGQTETAISIALAEKAATEGDYALQSRLESSRSLRQTRRGQEIVSERGRFEADSPHKYMRELLNKRLANLGANVKDALAETMNRATSVKQAAMDKIDSEAKKIKDAIKKDRKKIQMAQDIINSLICK